MLSIQQDQASGAGSTSWPGPGPVPMGFPVWFWQAAWLGWFLFLPGMPGLEEQLTQSVTAPQSIPS